MPWVVIESKGITVSGIDSTGTKFGQPGYFHFILTGIFLFFHLMPRVWAKRANLAVTAINLAFAVRNYFIISLCEAGECPDKQAGIFLIVIASVLMLISALFPDIQLPDKRKNNSVR
jgi:hypothetical protein